MYASGNASVNWVRVFVCIMKDHGVQRYIIISISWKEYTCFTKHSVVKVGTSLEQFGH